MNFCPLSENKKQSVCSALYSDSKMPKLKGVEGTKSHKKIRRKRPSASVASAVKGKTKLENKGKKVSRHCNFLRTFQFALIVRFACFSPTFPSFTWDAIVQCCVLPLTCLKHRRAPLINICLQLRLAANFFIQLRNRAP